MEPKKMAQQMIGFYKATFDNSFSALLMLQDQMERMTGMFMEQATGVPAEAKKALNDWLKAYKKGCEDFKKMADDNYKRVESFFETDKAKTV